MGMLRVRERLTMRMRMRPSVLKRAVTGTVGHLVLLMVHSETMSVTVDHLRRHGVTMRTGTKRCHSANPAHPRIVEMVLMLWFRTELGGVCTESRGRIAVSGPRLRQQGAVRGAAARFGAQISGIRLAVRRILGFWVHHNFPLDLFLLLGAGSMTVTAHIQQLHLLDLCLHTLHQICFLALCAVHSHGHSNVPGTDSFSFFVSRSVPRRLLEGGNLRVDIRSV